MRVEIKNAAAIAALVFAIFTCNNVYGQSISVTPTGYVTVGLGATRQFTAKVTGLTNSSITWRVGRAGSTGLGTISSAGLYTAPATMPSNGQVQITATSVSNPTVSGSTFLYLLPAGPTITSVTPNPIPTGTITVTLQGTGFQSGASVFDGNVQMSTLSVTSTSVTATGYQGPATSTSFYAVNPGSSKSNTVTAPVGNSSSGGGSGSGGSGSGSGGSGSGGSSPSAPVLTSVSPNPMPVGTIDVTITGTGFQSGALVYDASDGGTAIQTSPNSVTASSISVTIYQGPASTSTFTVKNPGSPASNAISVPVSGSSSGSGSGSGSGGNGGGSQLYTLTVVNGTVSNPSPAGTYAAGTTVTITANAPPAGQAFQSWTGAAVANTIASTTTLTMPAANTTVTANYYTPTPVPFPVTTHPRIWITQQDLPRLQSWAVPTNVTYQGLSAVLNQAIANYGLAFPGAALSTSNPVPASPYPDFGDTQGYTGMLSEENAVILAFNSLIDPSPVNQMQYAQAARNLLMYAMNQAALGHSANSPFRDPAFAIYNRASFTGHEWPLIVDWIYNTKDGNGNAILTSSDKATIQRVFMMWAADCLTASTTGGDNPGTPGLENSLSLLPNNKPYRMASNNYYLAHARLLTMMSLVLDPADDPPVNPAVAPSALGNTLRSYIQDATGAWLYQEFAMMGDPQTVAQAYGVPNNPTGAGFGLASGGLPPEGTLYGESFAYVLGQLLALQTSGFNNQTYSGPQIQMIGAPVWDRYVTGLMSSLIPTPFVPASESYIGSVYETAAYGDMLRLWVTPDQMSPFALLGLLDGELGVTTHVNASRWFAVNVMPNGSAGLLSRMTNPWTWGVTQDLLYYMLLDPAAPAAADPRPSFPALFYDPPAGRIVAHTDWSPAGTMFDYRASWISINHQDGASGQFGLFRKGEWLTKEMSNYDNGGGGNGGTTEFHNTLALQNWCFACASINWQGVDLPAWTNGSQWMEGENAGDPATSMSAGPGYVYATSDLTNLYNRPNIWTPQNSVTNITQATRSIVWLNSDYIIVYDRATSLNSGLFKKFNMSLVANPNIAGKTVTDTLPSGQQLFVQTLLPQNASITSFNGAATLNPIADLEPTRYILQVQDPTDPTDTRFLHVVQGADPGAPMAPAVYLQSTGGIAFDGAAFGSTAVFFPVNVVNSNNFTGTTLAAVPGVHTMLVTGLSPNTGYSVSVLSGPGGATVTVNPGGTAGTTDAAGVLTVSF